MGRQAEGGRSCRDGLRRRAARESRTGGQSAPVCWGEQVEPVGLVEDVLQHQRVHVHECGLQDAQARDEHLLLVAAVAGDGAVVAVGDDVVGAVGRLDDVEAFLDLTLQVPQPQVATDTKIVRWARPTSSIAA